MSNGAQIGGIIGAAIGGYITMSPQGAQLGYMIGSTDGGKMDTSSECLPAGIRSRANAFTEVTFEVRVR